MTGIKPYTLQDVQDLTDDAVRRSSQRHEKWDALEKLYRYGTIFGGDVPAEVAGQLALKVGIPIESVNLVLPAVNIILASVVSRDPQLLAEPLSGGDEAEQAASVAQAVLAYFWKRTRGTGDLRDMAQDMVILGSGFGKVGWSHLEHEEPREEQQVLAELTAAIDADRRLATLEGRQPTPVDELVEMIPMAASMVDRDEPFFEYVSPFDVFVPLDARRLHEARWVCQRLTLPADEVREHPAFENTDRIKVDGRPDQDGDTSRTYQARRGNDGVEIGRDDGSDVFETATIFEFYDMRTRKLTVFQMEADRPLFHDELPYLHRHSPFVHMRNYSDGGKEFWPFGEIEAIAGLQHVFNEMLGEQTANARRSGNKYVVDKAYFTRELREALESDEPDVVAPVDLHDRDIREVFQSVPRDPLSADTYQMKADAQGLLREVLGLNDFQTGGVGADRMSATAAAVVDGVATLRAQDKVAQVETAAAHAGELMLLLCQEFMDTERAIRVAGPNGAAWPMVSSEDIEGEFLVAVEGGSTQSVNPATRHQRATEMLTVVAPTLANLQFDPTPVLRTALRDLDLDPDQALVPLEAPAQAGGAPPEPPAGGEAPPAQPPADGGAADALAAFGGPPIPAATEGDVAL